MSSTTTTVTTVLCPWDVKTKKGSVQSDDSLTLQTKTEVPKSFIWHLDDIGQPKEKLNAPVIDLKGFYEGDELAIENAARLIREACSEHGFFLVKNHGVDPNVISEAYHRQDDFFKLPMEEKLKALKKPGTMWGFALAHSDRFSSNLPWKETFSFAYKDGDTDEMVLNYLTSLMGSDFEPMGKVYQKYCEAMNGLALSLTELLAISLGVDRSYYKDFYQEAYSTMRCNFYPPCDEPSKVLGTGPHCDPTSITILYQDQVGGLEVFANNKWQTVEPHPDALVINIGDTFMALTNGKYKSCLHRAVVNESKERKSMVFFLNPKYDKVVTPPENISIPRQYPDFTWADLFGFTQKHYRSDEHTLEKFTEWFASKSGSGEQETQCA